MAKGYLIGKRGVEAIKRLVNTSTLTPSGATGAKLIESLRFPAPFTIRWSTEVGGWMVALGDISYNGAEISVSDIENVDGWPDPWYKVTTLESRKRSGYVYLHIKQDNTALITFDEAIDEKPLLTIRLAYIHYRDGEDEDGGLYVQQLVTSSIYLAGGARWMDPQLETE